jgi:LysR family glycine cleavage system transcriptional activator
MKRKLPSLLAVRYFESVGRHLSFTAAAEELNVTQAAVSHQVRQLEERLGHQLFVRLHHRIALTETGEQLLAACTRCLEDLEEVFRRLGNQQEAAPLVLNVTPWISARWLLPRLNDYLSKHPDTDIVLHNSLKSPLSDSEEFDLKIFYSGERLNDSTFEILFTDQIVPICSPTIASPGKSLTETEFVGLNLVHEFDHEWWTTWCERAGLGPDLAKRGLIVDDPVVLEKAALLGHGLILGSETFTRDRVVAGELIYPFGTSVSIPIYYYVVAKSPSPSSSVCQLKSWIIENARQIKP